MDKQSYQTKEEDWLQPKSEGKKRNLCKPVGSRVYPMAPLSKGPGSLPFNSSGIQKLVKNIQADHEAQQKDRTHNQ